MKKIHISHFTIHRAICIGVFFYGTSDTTRYFNILERVFVRGFFSALL